MISATLGFWVLVALAVQALVADRRPSLPTPAQPQPRAVLDGRLARGEIDPEEYRRVRAVLDTSSAPAAQA